MTGRNHWDYWKKKRFANLKCDISIAKVVQCYATKLRRNVSEGNARSIYRIGCQCYVGWNFTCQCYVPWDGTSHVSAMCYGIDLHMLLTPLLTSVFPVYGIWKELYIRGQDGLTQIMQPQLDYQLVLRPGVSLTSIAKIKPAPISRALNVSFRSG